MPYYLNYTNGTSLQTVADGTTDNTTVSITLIGKNFPTYGQVLNQNLINLLENFSNGTEPSFPILGQIWYDSTNKVLNLYREGSAGDYWQKLAMTTESDTAPTNPRLGDLWWDSVNSQLKLYDTNSSEWRVIGPQTTTEGSLRVTGTNGFKVQVNGNTTFTIDSNGGINFRYNPCFYGYDTKESLDVTSSGVSAYNTWSPKTSTFDSIDRASNWNDTTNVFHVTTSGVYQVYAHVTTIGGTNPVGQNEMRLSWYKNGSDVNINASNNHTIDTKQQLVCSGFINASVGDNINLVYSTSIGCYISKSNAAYSIRLVG
jgi:hypothetical protein